jgi:hypothetical protein
MSNDSDSSDDDRFFHFRNMRKQSEKAKQERRNKGGGLKVGKAFNLNRFWTDYNKLLKKDYIGENPIYSTAIFRRHFLMSCSLSDKILVDLVASDLYFSRKKDA